MSPGSRSRGRGRGLLLAGALVATACTAAPAAPTSAGRRLLLVGLDGADWQAIDPLVSAGRLPVFARLRAHGRTGTMLATPPLLSPILWTTIATGRRPEDHRILDFMVDVPGGGQAPVPSTERRVAALWNVFSNAGRRVGVVGWWATWPAEDVNGTVVSDRVAPQLVRAGAPIEPGSIAPAGQAALLGACCLVRATDLARDDLAAYVPLTAAEYRAAQDTLRHSGARLYRDPLAHLAAIAASTRTYGKMAEALVADAQPDLLLVYLEGIDSISHRFAKDPRRGPGAIARSYEDADTLVGRLAARVAPDTWVVVVSDHGFYGADAGVVEDPSELEGPASAWHRPYGIAAAAEARDLSGAAAGGRPANAGTITPLDVAPTLLHAAGLPVSREMPGAVVPALLPDEAAARAVARVDSVERPHPSAPAVALAPDDATRERLQALGYVGASSTSLARLNLGEILYRRGDFGGAERELRQVVDAQPKNVPALLWLAKAVAAQGRARSALDVYARALALPGDQGDALVEAVDLAASERLPEEARRMVASSPQLRGSAAAAVARATVARLDGRADVELRELRAALAIDASFLPALEGLLDRLVADGRAKEALRELRAAAGRAPRSPRHQALFGLGLLASGDAAGAEAALALASSLAPNGVSVRVELARAQLAQGKADAALRTLAPVSASVEALSLRGAAHASRRDWALAAASYQAALDVGPPTPDLLNALAWARVQLGQKPEATRLLARSLALRQDQPAIRQLLARIDGRER